MTKSSSSMTASMQPLIESVGLDAAIQLAARLGGTRVLVRADPHPNDALARAVGLQWARQIAGAIGPGVLAVPRCLAWLLARRNEEIAARYDAGESQVELALRFGLTERQISRILSDSAAAEPPVADMLTEGPKP